MTRKKLIARLDKVFSQWVRRKDADHRGYVECWTCGKVLPWSRVDAGHFQSRAKFSTRWDEMNVKPQCKSCNGFRSGEQFKFARKLDAVYGQGTAEEIERTSNQTRKYSVEELEALIDVYNRRLRKL
jgi:hypothetical protein